jgi:hypothetical protein
MLALDDQAMALVFVAASAIPPDKRKAWLADVAHQLDQISLSGEIRSAPLAPSTVRTRRWRARESAGQVLLTVAVDEASLVVRLVADGLLNPTVADSRKALTTATERAWPPSSITGSSHAQV